MHKNKNNIPINSMDGHQGQGISIEQISFTKADFKTGEQYGQATQSHRDEGYTFHLVEKGTVSIEIDFNKYKIKAPAVVYMHPEQVHRILDFTTMSVCSLAITNEHINPGYLTLLEELAPATPLALSKKDFAIIWESASLCLKFSADEKSTLRHLLLKDSCNTLVGLMVAAFLNDSNPSNRLSRAERITKSFKQLLEKQYCSTRQPSAYATQLHISTHYLNESVKNTTGASVSQHIQDRVMLEAKRLLYHTDKSVKEIAFELGFDDYPYFSRLFTRATGMTALTFRHKRHD